MGWTYAHRPKGVSYKEFFEQEFNYSRTQDDGTEATGKVLDVATKNGASYIAYELSIKKPEDTEPKREIFAIVALGRWEHNFYYNFGYKDMDETMHPCFYDCPERILNLLTPTTHEDALRWREKCREKLEAEKAVGRIRYGDVVVLEEPITFVNGMQEKVLVRVHSRKHSYVSLPSCWTVKPDGSVEIDTEILKNRMVGRARPWKLRIYPPYEICSPREVEQAHVYFFPVFKLHRKHFIGKVKRIVRRQEMAEMVKQINEAVKVR